MVVRWGTEWKKSEVFFENQIELVVGVVCYLFVEVRVCEKEDVCVCGRGCVWERGVVIDFLFFSGQTLS